MAEVLDGKALAERLREGAQARISAAAARLGRSPRLALVSLGGGNEAQVYFRRERKAAAAAGVQAFDAYADPAAGPVGLEARLKELSLDPAVDAIVVGMPPPAGFDAARALAALDPAKDVEGLAPLNQGLFYGCRTLAELGSRAAFAPCTALAVLKLIRASGVPVAGARATVVGRSSVVGRPVAHLLSCLDATVTLTHSRTRDLVAACAGADILVAAAGRPGLIGAAMVKPGAVVIDAGASASDGGVAGDVDFRAVSGRAGWITPVPGGVGPVTVAELLSAVAAAAERRAGLPVQSPFEGL